MNYIKLNRKRRNTTTIKYKNGVPYISYNALEKIPWITHGFSTRAGGVSEGCLSSMNLGHGRNDAEENVIRNHEIIAEAIGFDAHNIVASRQTHTTNVRVVSKEDCGKGVYKERDYDDVDGMITNEKNIVLATYFADCVPLYIVDTKNKAIGLSHSGWKGTAGGMGRKTVEAMEKAFGSRPEDILVGIGPSICQDCYEVSEDVAEAFRNLLSGEEMKKVKTITEEQILKDKRNGKYQLDLWKANEAVCLSAGIRPEHISVTDICTCCNPGYLFSHRASNGKRGNLGMFVVLN